MTPTIFAARMPQGETFIVAADIQSAAAAAFRKHGAFPIHITEIGE